MPEAREAALSKRIRAAGPGLAKLLAEAQEVWRARAAGDADGGATDGELPRWRPFEDAFPSFYQFTNRPR